MSFNYSVSLNDPTNAGGSADAALVYDLQQALGVWSGYLSGLGTLVVELDISNTTEGRASGGPTSDAFVGTNGQGDNVYESSAFYEMTTGRHVQGTSSDITITIDPGYFQYLDLQAGLTYSSSVPSNLYNPIDIFLHEVMHGFGQVGYYSQTGTLSGNSISTFDTFIQKTATGANFVGPHAEAAYGGPVPLTTTSTDGENYYHFGNEQSDLFKTPATVQDPLTLDLMNGIVFFFDYQYQISALDLGVLQDLGYTMGSAPPTTAPEMTVLGNGVAIANGDATPSTADATDFGTVLTGSAGPSETFTVRNAGNATLSTSGLTLPTGFTLVDGLASSIAPGASDTFTVQLTTGTAGTYGGTISFGDNVSGENPFSFDVTGTVAPSLFGPSQLALSGFAAGAGGWASQDQYPRVVGDVTGDGLADIVGFGYSGVWVAPATGGGQFAQPFFAVNNFGASAGGGGWTSQDQYPRELADVNGDGKADIVGFGYSGPWVALATGGGQFAQPFLAVNNFGASPDGGGWVSQDQYPRELADVNGDGMADIVGFGQAGVYVSLATGGGHFAGLQLELSAFAPGAGGWDSQDQYPRELADVNGDGMADIVGFGQAGVYVALATGGGHFAAPQLALSNFAVAAGGWASQDQYPRELADVNGDGKADIVGFGANGVYVSHGRSDGTFDTPTFGFADFGAGSSAGGWSSDDTYPRAVADVTRDHKADIVGSGFAGVYVAPSHDTSVFST